MSDLILILDVASAAAVIFIVVVTHRRMSGLTEDVRRAHALARLAVIALAAHLDGRDVTIDIGECTCPRCQPMPLRTDDKE